MSASMCVSMSVTVSPPRSGEGLQPRTTPPPSPPEDDLHPAPSTVAWEVTRACVLACAHCRPDVWRRSDPRELTTDEGYRLIDRLTEFGSPTLLFTGGDPMMRRDLFDLVGYADDAGLRCTLAPSATAWPTKQRLRLAALAGVRRVAVGLDGPTPEVHDRFRRVPGSWERTMTFLGDAQAAGLATQVLSTVTTRNLHLLEDMRALLAEVGVVGWSLSFLVARARGEDFREVSREERDAVVAWLRDLHRHGGAGHGDAGRGSTGPGSTGRDSTGPGSAEMLCRVDDGRGLLRVSHCGDITPSKLPAFTAGNVRTHDVVEVYRRHPLFQALRDPLRSSGTHLG